MGTCAPQADSFGSPTTDYRAPRFFLGFPSAVDVFIEKEFQ
jgi:hypothetical protein